MKKTIPIKNVVDDFMNTLVSLIDMNYFYAFTVKLQKEKFTTNEIANAELTCDNAINRISRSIDDLKHELFKLCKKGKWELARAILAEFDAELLRFSYAHYSFGAVKWYIEESVRMGNYLEAKYLPQFGIVYGEIKGKVRLSIDLINEDSIEKFHQDIVFMASLGMNLVTQLKEDIHNKQYNEEWDKYSEVTLNINDIFNSSEARQDALDKLIELSVFDWVGNKPELILMQNWKEKGEKSGGKKGSGLKRMLGAWLDACDNKGFLDPNYNDTTRAMVALKFFGIKTKGENSVREMIGKKLKVSNYAVHFENW